MAHGRSPILLLIALVALFAVPASALAQGDPNVPVNTTDPSPGQVWLTSPYEVELTGTDVEDLDVDMQWRLGAAGAVTTVPTGSLVTISDQGQHQFETQALDDSGNVSGWRTEDLWIDMVEPTDATSPGTGWFPAPTTVSVDAVDITSGVDHIEYILDGAPVQSAANGFDVPVSGDGTHLLRTRAVDVAGNVSDWRDHTIRVDTVTPTDTTAVPSGWQTAPLSVSVTGADVHSGIDEVTWRIDGGTPTTTTTVPGSLTVSAEGEHTVETYVRDAAGHATGWKAHTVRIDTTAPANTTLPSDGAWRMSDYHVLVTATDSGSTLQRVEWRVDGGPWLNGPSGSQADVTGTGDHVLETRARDVAGNVSVTRSEPVRIDQVVPTNTTAPPPASPVGNPYQVAVTGTDAHAGVTGVEWQVDGGPTESGTVATVSGHGPHTLRTRVIDGAGNASGWRTDNITIDATLGDNQPPIDTTTAGSATVWRNAPIDVTVQAEDAGSGVAYVEWRIPGEPTTNSLADDPSFTFDEEGDHVLETRAFDVAGNGTSWRRQHYKVDLSVPVDTIDVPAGWQQANTFELSATDAFSGVDEVEYEIDGGPLQQGDDGDVVTVGADGSYTIVSRVIDNAGHSSAYTTRTLKVDSADPVNTTAVPGNGWSTEPLELELTGTDALSGVEVMQWRVDAGEIRDGGPAIVDADGEHVLETRATDAAGNETDWRSDTVRIDATAPENTTPAPAAGWRKTPYTVVVSGDDGAGSGVDRIERTVDGGAASGDENVTITGDGVHILRTRIVDLVGHASVWRQDTIRIDSKAPTASLACNGGTKGWSRSAVTCTVGANGGPSGLSALKLSRNGAAAQAIASGKSVGLGTGVHTLALAATDGAGNQGSAAAKVYVDATAPTAGLTCTPVGAKHSCRVDAADTTSGLDAVSWNVDGGAWTGIAAGGTFTVTEGKVAVRAVDVAGNAIVTAAASLTAPQDSSDATVKISSAPVYLAGERDAGGLVGALDAARSANGTVSLDLRPLAVGRGRYKVQVRMKAGKRRKTFKRAYKVGRGGTLPRLATSLSRADRRCTIKLVVRKRAGRKWRRYATTRLVLPK